MDIAGAAWDLLKLVLGPIITVIVGVWLGRLLRRERIADADLMARVGQTARAAVDRRTRALDERDRALTELMNESSSALAAVSGLRVKAISAPDQDELIDCAADALARISRFLKQCGTAKRSLYLEAEDHDACDALRKALSTFFLTLDFDAATVRPQAYARELDEKLASVRACDEALRAHVRTLLVAAYSVTQTK